VVVVSENTRIEGGGLLLQCCDDYTGESFTRVEEGGGRLLQRSDEHMWELFRRAEEDEEATGAEEFGFLMANKAKAGGGSPNENITTHHRTESSRKTGEDGSDLVKVRRGLSAATTVEATSRGKKCGRSGRTGRQTDAKRRIQKNDEAEQNLHAIFVACGGPHTTQPSAHETGLPLYQVFDKEGEDTEHAESGGLCDDASKGVRAGAAARTDAPSLVDLMGAEGRGSELDALTLRGAACCDKSSTNFEVGVPASQMEGGAAVGTEACASGAVAVPGELFSPAPRSRSAQKASRKKEAKEAQWAAEQAAKS